MSKIECDMTNITQEVHSHSITSKACGFHPGRCEPADSEATVRRSGNHTESIEPAVSNARIRIMFLT